jgi:glucokinase
LSVYIGLDIGGTKLMAAAADQTGRISRRARRATPAGLPDGLALLDEMIAEVAGGESIAGIGAAIGGPLDWSTGVVSPLHQPEWRDVPLKDLMQARWSCPFYVDVDTNVAALGEYSRAGLSSSTFLYITISTGMGGGLLKSGKIYRGGGGAHPEIAHQAVPWKCSHPERIACECGSADCLEALVSGNGIQRVYGKPAEELNAGEWEEVAWNLGQGVRNIAVLYAPDEISIGGGVAVGAGEKLLPRAVEVMKQHLRLVPAPRVYLSLLGYDTALTGALRLAVEGLRE